MNNIFKVFFIGTLQFAAAFSIGTKHNKRQIVAYLAACQRPMANTTPKAYLLSKKMLCKKHVRPLRTWNTLYFTMRLKRDENSRNEKKKERRKKGWQKVKRSKKRKKDEGEDEDGKKGMHTKPQDVRVTKFQSKT